jgi:hypothetical protein
MVYPVSVSFWIGFITRFSNITNISHLPNFLELNLYIPY